MKNNKNKRKINLALILPIILLVVEILAVVILLVSGYTFSSFLPIFLILLAIFLTNQIVRQATFAWKVRKANLGVSTADSLRESGKPMEAIKKYKEVLLELPKDEYLATLSKMGETYQDHGMDAAVQQVEAIRSESMTFFEMTSQGKRFTPQDRQHLQAKVYELRNMIQALPEEKGQTLEDVNPANKD